MFRRERVSLSLAETRMARCSSRASPLSPEEGPRHVALTFSRPQLERDDPLNLSILLRGGKENNDDSLSKGD